MTTASRAGQEVPGWRDLRHGGLLLDGQRLADLAPYAPDPLDGWTEHQLRRRATDLRRHATDEAPAFAKFVLEEVCGFDAGTGTWTRGANVGSEWSRRAPTGELVKPRQLWEGLGGGRLPVFMEPGPRVGIGKGRRTVSRVLGWLRAGNDHLALVTNGKQWRLLFAGLDFEAWCEWDVDLWFQDGKPAPQVDALRTLLQPNLWTPASKDAASPLLQAIRDTRKGQAELSETLGERVREAVEVLIQGHGEALKEQCSDVDPADIYRAACRVAMRLVVILFAEARDLLPRDNPVYHASYGLNGLMERLQSAAGGHALSRRFSAWPQVQALFTLVHDGSHLPQMPVKDYGGELFKPGSAESADGLSRALAVFETACLKQDVLPDDDVRRMLDRMTLTWVRIRQGRGGTRVTVPVDFSDLSSDYIGILYEGLLDYELKTAPPGEPVIFLAAGHYPALPLSRLEAMDDKAIKALFSNLKKDVAADDDGPEESEGQAAVKGEANNVEDAAGPLVGDSSEASADGADPRFVNRTRAEKWARRAASVAGLFRKPRGKLTPERRLKAEDDLARKARKLVARVVLPGEWYLVRWGGTRKGSGSFYTRPGLVVPTVQRTLRPLAYDPPLGKDGEPDRDAPAAKWTPKRPEAILELKVCDPACGSGAFVLSALRFQTNALFASLQRHGRIEPHGERTMVRLLGVPADGADGERLGDELIPCPQNHDDFEPRLRAVLRRHVVERCIYAVDIDPLAVELCRLSLWIETMDRGLPFGFLDHKVKCGNSLVGAWFDQFAHYPVMAWKNREGGDKNHGNGVHFAKGARTKAIKAFVKDQLKRDLAVFLRDPDLFLGDHLKRHDKTHRNALAVLEKMHALPVQDATERARLYRDEFVGSSAWLSLKDAMDLWCALWFWPANETGCASLPTTLAEPSQEALQIARRLADENLFFHWELEFPDVFRSEGSGFDALLTNPPWETLQQSSHEFFSNVDPMYRSYGSQEALGRQHQYFLHSRIIESTWLDYLAETANAKNWSKFVGNPFGDPLQSDSSSISRFSSRQDIHNRWRKMRVSSVHHLTSGPHPFLHSHTGKAYTYRLFLELVYCLGHANARLGAIVPSGLYSSHGSRSLRRLLLEQCHWEWCFGMENRYKIFPIHGSYKFCIVIINKNTEASTDVIRTAFMKRQLDDWERGDEMAAAYPRKQITRFSPTSLAILEVQSKRDLDVLEKMHAQGVRFGDSDPCGWDIRYRQADFNITNMARLFPPRPTWEAMGYRPDEYGRWLSGNWRPIEDLFSHRFGNVAHGGWQRHCACPPYDKLPVARVHLSPGVILSRECDAWIRDEEVEQVALPLYEGRMIGQFDISKKGWVSGRGRRAIWRQVGWEHKCIEPQFLMMDADYRARVGERARHCRILYMRVSAATNARTTLATLAKGMPSVDSAPSIYTTSLNLTLALAGILNSFVFDFANRMRLVGTTIDYHLLEQNPLPSLDEREALRVLAEIVARLNASSHWFAVVRLRMGAHPHAHKFALTQHERTRLIAIADALVAMLYGLDGVEFRSVIKDCDLPISILADTGVLLNSKGFWRVDKGYDPELRRSVLALVAFHDLRNSIRAMGGDRNLGIRDWVTQNSGEGWLVPETLRLADYDLGHDERAKYPQPVSSRLGSRFYDWQLAQSPEEAWQECHLHARNLLGAGEYGRLLDDLDKSCHHEGHDDSGLPLSDLMGDLASGGSLLDCGSNLFGTDEPS